MKIELILFLLFCIPTKGMINTAEINLDIIEEPFIQEIGPKYLSLSDITALKYTNKRNNSLFHYGMLSPTAIDNKQIHTQGILYFVHKINTTLEHNNLDLESSNDFLSLKMLMNNNNEKRIIDLKLLGYTNTDLQDQKNLVKACCGILGPNLAKTTIAEDTFWPKIFKSDFLAQVILSSQNQAINTIPKPLILDCFFKKNKNLHRLIENNSHLIFDLDSDYINEYLFSSCEKTTLNFCNFY